MLARLPLDFGDPGSAAQSDFGSALESAPGTP